jgi:excinuclease ABC subunit C
MLQKQSVDASGILAGRKIDADIIGVVVAEGRVCVNLAMIRGSRHLGDRAFFPHIAIDWQQDDQTIAHDALVAFVEQHYAERTTPTLIVTNIEIDATLQEELTPTGTQWLNTVAAGRRPVFMNWLHLTLKNAEQAIQRRQLEAQSQENRLIELLNGIDWPIEEADYDTFRIECFDISHTAGEATQASCVVYQHCTMQAKEYRRYNINGITGGDDYAAMRQVLTRRYSKIAAALQTGEGVMPNMVLIDGGKGQVSIAREVFDELGLDRSLIMGIAKGDHRKVGLETLLFADERPSIQLGEHHPGLMLIASIRDEAHRFAITGMRAQRAKNRTTSQLDEITGIGPKRKKNLLAHFGGAKGVLAASAADIAQVEGISTKLAEEIWRQLH